MDNINHILSKELGISLKQVTSVIEMLDEGNTVPFIARYRKERTGGLTDEVLRKFNERLTYLRNLESRKEDVLRIIEEQEKLTPELKLKIEKATTLTEIEDIYRPFKAKKRTRATMAVEKGLKPLAELILSGEFNGDIVEEANKYINEEKGVKNEEEALQGAMDIISEIISDNADYRKWIRNFVQKEVKNALEKAYIEYEKYTKHIKEKGEEFIEYAKNNNKKVIVVAGRPYHIDPEINHGIDKVLSSLGIVVLTEDSIEVSHEKPKVNILNQWTYQARLYNAAYYVAKNKDMELIQLVSFGCGTDAITSDEVKDILERNNKIYTQLKIDETNNLGAAKIRIRSLLEAIAQE